ncbi:MAG: hypothetical protein ABH879_05950 [archaeon]
MILPIFLGILPALSYFMQERLAARDGRIAEFKRNWTIRYADWVLVPFNVLWLYSAAIGTGLIFSGALIGIAVNGYAHWAWSNDRFRSHLIRDRRLSPAGFVHLVFASAETAMMAIFIFSPIKNAAVLANSVVLIIFSVLIALGSKKIHGAINRMDLAGALLIFCATSVKLAVIFI